MEIEFFHSLTLFKAFFNPFFSTISFFGEHGLFFIVLSLILMLFSKTRKVGFSMLLSLGIGALFTNVIIKNFVQRVRPYNASLKYNEYWLIAGKTIVGEYSFPSGHATSTTAVLMAVFMLTNKKYSWLSIVGILFMGASRVYLVVHYPTDVIGGFIVGGLSSLLGCYLVSLLFRWLNKNSNNKICNFLLNASIF